MKITLEDAAVSETEVIIRGDITSAEVTALLQHLTKKPSSKLLLYRDDEQHIINAEDIVYIESGGNHINVYTQTGVYETKLKLYELTELLSPLPFAQISKSTVVNINFVKSIQAEFSGNYTLKLKDRKDILLISRKYFKEFKQRI